ncbi:MULTISPECIES: DUF2235 domain-containing protein [unclassified Wenzhouxiangella]|uniref:DUF2235 domain-containing protein n=1 Tax=unclassified Wenzhouxiangella TaxID=2613841 RepID=UPI000E32CCF9|nr:MULTISPECIES: DUF2235 domain-containing protein [unclassified Wenzhouxiangella]RFF26726.1 DUF2235 domain-containing protein [Wenzhouxiangella sp. 15181]RFP69304.1 DUF2235 domain-containing protein [Wenzhouxiangella sp. 15190]
MKRIVICCDGTWSSADRKRNGESAPTNVVRLAEVVAGTDSLGVEQRVYYGPGVGSDGSWLYRWFAGATGWGLSDNLKDAYRFAVKHYQPGDELFLFGYSRGAFTVRSLAGMIHNAGILRHEFADRVDAAFDLYKSRSPLKHPDAAKAVRFRERFTWGHRTPIQFIGVWDTVGALGNPLLLHKSPLSRRVQFHDTRLGPNVRCAYHALAIDEKRRHFQATRWRRHPDAGEQIMEQRWFVGVHGDVGGGSPNDGLSDITFDWMMRQARQCGLAFDTVSTEPDVFQGPARSRRGLFRLIPRWHRPIADEPPRHSGEIVDASAERRWQDDSEYHPPNLADFFRRHSESS